eukprot:CAMPEP_0185010930 /NCGR_PEP_ID=MMETSP1098-20130426/96255_1 /TAXON_ID=89044 /ORGANISM="Spumella elongata, Strain CCAP 955/1" /LENGTH=48 /DNA_ID= /DNA_START= /DNA_END= /DNA_ORIENTATION=
MSAVPTATLAFKASKFADPISSRTIRSRASTTLFASTSLLADAKVSPV